MRIVIKKGIGLHRCAHCKSFVNDADFIDCGVIFAPQLSLMFDYKCHICEYLGRYTMAASDANADLAVAFEFLTEIVVVVPESQDKGSGA